MPVIKTRIRDLLNESQLVGKRITQSDLAEATGITQPSIAAILSGKTKNPRIEVLQSIASYFSSKLGRRITIDDLIQSEPQSEPQPHGPHTQPTRAMFEAVGLDVEGELTPAEVEKYHVMIQRMDEGSTALIEELVQAKVEFRAKVTQQEVTRGDADWLEQVEAEIRKLQNLQESLRAFRMTLSEPYTGNSSGQESSE